MDDQPAARRVSKLAFALTMFVATTSAATCVYALTAVRAVRDSSITAVEAVRDNAIAPVPELAKAIVAAGVAAAAAERAALDAAHRADLNAAVMFKLDDATTLIVELTKLTGAITALTARVGEMDARAIAHERDVAKHGPRP